MAHRSVSRAGAARVAAGCLTVGCTSREQVPPAARPAPTAEAASPKPVVFDTTLALQGISFHVSSTTQGSVGQATITPNGLEIDNAPMTQEIDGRVTAAEVADLDADGSPEIYVYVTSAGSGSYGSLVAYAANRRKSLSQVFLPPIVDNADAALGYMGHDEFHVVDGRLVRRFPVYKDTDTNANPTGGTRQVRYRLAKGEAGWVLQPDRIDTE